MENIFAIYKPKGITSNDAVNIVRRALHVKKVGHAGTLDPLAEGVLVIGVGREATKHLGKVMLKEKEYKAEIRLGIESTTDDEEGIKTKWRVAVKPTIDSVKEILPAYIGCIIQTPPPYSALKIRGKPAYAYARQGNHIIPNPRNVFIKEIECCSYKWPILRLRIVTGPGVYIRALARDIGKDLSVGGYLTSLLRTRVGEFTLEEARTLNILEQSGAL
jgi:tRNA pseudouridine55 synthase